MSTADQEPKAVVFHYDEQKLDSGKSWVGLGSAGMVKASVQFLKQGGDNNLHAHSNEDEVFLVLSGRVRFYGKGDKLIAELGTREGIVIPRMFAYWFESVGDDQLELYKVGAYDPSMKNDRVNFEGIRESQVTRGDTHTLTGRPPTGEELAKA